MSSHTLGILIGGLIPALCFGIANFLLKAGQNAGVGVGYFLFSSLFGMFFVGILFHFLLPGDSVPLKFGMFGFLWGVFGGMGAGLVIFAIHQYGTPIGVLAPLFNMNTLITVLLALWVFAEWKDVKVPQLLLGSVLIVIGGTLVARS